MSTQKMENFKLKAQIWDIFKEWCESSSSHGIPNMARSKNRSLTIMWAIFFSVSTCYCLYLITGSIKSYLSNPVLINIDVISEMPALFPSVSICNLNPFNTETIQNRNQMFKVITENNLTLTYDKLSAFEKKKSFTNYLNIHLSMLSDTEKSSYSYKLEDMLISAYFNGDEISTDSFEWFYDFKYGNCYRFNTNSSNYKYVGFDGASSALELELYIGNSSDNQPFISDRGIRVLINNNTIKSYPFEDGINAEPGKKTNIKIKRTFYERLGPPYSDCLKDLTAQNPNKNIITQEMFSRFNQTVYTKKFCFKVCFQRYVIIKCNCSDPSFDSYLDRKCATLSQIECQNQAFASFNTNPESICKNSCKTECSYVKYDTYISQAEYLANWYWTSTKSFYENKHTPLAKKINEIGSLEEAKKNMLSIMIHYDDLTYTYIKESAQWSIETLFSEFGGQLGLFVGISILSFGEIIELIVKMFIALKKSYKISTSNYSIN